MLRMQLCTGSVHLLPVCMSYEQESFFRDSWPARWSVPRPLSATGLVGSTLPGTRSRAKVCARVRRNENSLSPNATWNWTGNVLQVVLYNAWNHLCKQRGQPTDWYLTRIDMQSVQKHLRVHFVFKTGNYSTYIEHLYSNAYYTLTAGRTPLRFVCTGRDLKSVKLSRNQDSS